ncbi:parallel beta-helix domain-containing protein [Runella slithyformis]|uniref:Parallel beta-helix repeat-containing protein n=1 Tax=Runella slithyformis (strain ATCC 29530 / DSM 19594 / LMG 11500 / NCIMB 11436 / LSU 4) TaxID=761193 RepID=A0A7U3ZJL6_RUNSL|nr:parallel beta-helix domain-containing protein [Runella slithyformis]AEI48437.1 parallel beta-helix repeat-containing protein [Runella slithyformis DSM 19594]
MRFFPCLLLSITSLSAVAQADFQKKLQRQLIMAEDGSTITIEAGTYTLSGSLSLEGKKNITVRGAGLDKTILSFKGQTEGAEGVRVSNAENIILENFTVQDAKGDAIKTMNVQGITFKNVKTEWTGEPKATNGAYGLYPVMCQNVLIDGCVAIGASDAGIYVGQSKNIIVRNSRAYHNVAGIEIENSLMADVYDNESTENTGGILVFDLPDLVQKKGGNVRVYNNNIHHNNFPNFAPKGNIVANVPQGTGVMILATNHVEIFNNKIIRNNSIGTSIISYFMTENKIKDKEYYPYPTGIYIHDNVYERDRVRYQGRGRMGQLFRYKLRFGKKVPHIVYDGIVDPKNIENGQIKPDSRICIQNNQNATFVNIDAANNFKNVSRDATAYNCTHSALKQAVVSLK